jgi:hypothetical protein
VRLAEQSLGVAVPGEEGRVQYRNSRTFSLRRGQLQEKGCGEGRGQD